MAIASERLIRGAPKRHPGTGNILLANHLSVYAGAQKNWRAARRHGKSDTIQSTGNTQKNQDKENLTQVFVGGGHLIESAHLTSSFFP